MLPSGSVPPRPLATERFAPPVRTMRVRNGLLRQAVQDDETELGSSFHLGLHAIERESLIRNMGIALELCINREKIVCTAHFDAVAGKKKRRPILRQRLDHRIL
jgi:hypothetical protein